MKTAVLFFPASAVMAAGLLTASCDSSSQSKAREAAAHVDAAAEETADKAVKAGGDLKEKAGVALDAGKDLGASALERIKNLGSKAADYARENLNLPEIDTVLDDFRGVLKDTRQAAEEGVSPEKRAELKARWDAAHTRIQEKTAELSPEVKQKLQGIISSLEKNWNHLMQKAEEKAVEARTN